jgi:transcriptional regulator with XRE-family HTH domain
MRSTPSEQGVARDGGAPGDDIGARLRAERERQRLSLRQLARRVNISASALSQIETGRSRPSVGTLYSIVSELGLSFDELFAGGPSGAARATSARQSRAARAAERVVQRAAERPVLELESGVRWERLNPTGERDVDFLEVEYDVGGASSRGGTLVHHGGREYGLVMSGVLKVTVGSDEYELRAGDSICFDSVVPHRLETLGNEPARAIWLVIGRGGGGWPGG